MKSLSNTCRAATRGIWILLLALMMAPGVADAKRKEPPKIEPVVHEGVVYSAPNDDGRRAHVKAVRQNADQVLWDVTVFRNTIDPQMEEDVQHVYISGMSVRGDKLIVVAENDRVYSVDLKTREVAVLKELPESK